MAGGTAPAHDPSTGFHDIKPAPEFSQPAPVSPALVSVFLILFLGMLFFRRFLKRQNKGQPAAAEAPLVRLEMELAAIDYELKSKVIPLREFGGRLSLALRGYLEAQLSSAAEPFPALDCTVPEVLQRLPSSLRRVGQSAGRQLGAPGDIADIIAPIGRILQRAEKLTFADERTLGSGLTEQQPPEQMLAEAKKIAAAIEELVHPAVPAQAAETGGGEK